MSPLRPLHPTPRVPPARELGREPASTEPHDRAESFAFWGRDRAAFGGPPGVSWFERLRGDPRVGVVALLATALVAGLVWYRIGVDASDEPVAASRAASRATAARRAASASVPTTRASGGERGGLVAHVAGAVVRPGIVRLRTGARVVDAIEAAGGPRPDADLDQLNLAAKIADGQRIAVGVPGAVVAGSSGLDAGAGTADATGPLNLNLATQSEIEELPGIGPVLGAAILRARDERGGFRSVDELRSVRGIGEKRFADLRDLVTV